MAWGCLNSARKRIENKEFRGFLLKKQGFSIGKRESLAHLFGTSNAYFDRYIGEIIVVSPDILPNAARNGLELSALKTWFDKQVAEEIAPYFVNEATEFQEQNKAEELLQDLGGQLKEVLSKFNPNEDNVNTLVSFIAKINSNIKSKLKANRNGKVTRNRRQAEFNQLLKDADDLENAIKQRINFLIKVDPTVVIKSAKTKVQIADKLKKYKASETLQKYESITAVIDSLGVEYSIEVRKILSVIDEEFVQALAESKSHYYRLLGEFKETIENLES